MTDNRVRWNRHGKVYLDPTIEKSVYIAFAEFCSDMAIDCSEVTALVKRKWQLNGSLFHLGAAVALDLAKAMGIEPTIWSHAQGSQLLAGRWAKQILLGELRYCRSCLLLGNHSALFQSTRVIWCPIHLETLRVGCPYCRKAIGTSAMSLARNHLYCGSCNRNLASERRRASVGGAGEHPKAGQFAALWRAVTETPKFGDLRSELRWNKLPAEVAACLALVRVHHTHSVWGDPLFGPGFLKIRTEVFELEFGKEVLSTPKLRALVRSAAIVAFEELATQLSKHVRLNEVPVGLEGAIHSAARVDIRVSTVTAAFWQTALALDVHRFVLGEMPPPEAKAPPFLSWLPLHAGAIRLLVLCQVRALFVRSLIRMSKLRYGMQMAWSELPEGPSFLLPWRLRALGRDGRLELQIRTKVDFTTVERLVARYRRHCLIEVPEGVSTVDLMRMTGSVG